MQEELPLFGEIDGANRKDERNAKNEVTQAIIEEQAAPIPQATEPESHGAASVEDLSGQTPSEIDEALPALPVPYPEIPVSQVTGSSVLPTSCEVSSSIESIPPIHIPPAAIRTFTRALIISVHDVSPHTLPAVERILADLEALGVHECSLLVVADHHRRGHMLDDLPFCNWLRDRVAAGHEAVIHGYFHARDRRPDDSLREKVTTRFYTKDEGEFFDIAGADALRIVSQARSEFRKLDVDPRGFIAPAWLLSEAGEVALRALGIDYTTRLTRVDDLVTGRSHRSQSLVWSVRSGWRRLASLGWNAFLFRCLRNNPLLRIGIHPPDIEYPAVWRQTLDIIRCALADRTPISYSEWVETSRSTAHVIQS